MPFRIPIQTVVRNLREEYRRTFQHELTLPDEVVWDIFEEWQDVEPQPGESTNLVMIQLKERQDR